MNEENRVALSKHQVMNLRRWGRPATQRKSASPFRGLPTTEQPATRNNVTASPPHIPSEVKMKRYHSPSFTTHAKVQHSSETSDTSGGRRRNLSFDEVFYDELIFVIFSCLSARDLCAIQPTNKNWARLSQDNQVHSK